LDNFVLELIKIDLLEFKSEKFSGDYLLLKSFDRGFFFFLNLIFFFKFQFFFFF
jgi:hypothetical protein